MVNIANQTTFRSGQRSVSLADQAQILGWRMAFIATRLAGQLWRDLAPVVYPVRYFVWLPPLAAVFGFVVGLGMALTVR